jgi:DNA-binding response OmpR family regulator
MTKILVVDDSALMRNLLGKALEEAGFQVEAFLPASEAELMDRLGTSSPDLVLTDFNMPALDGKTVARATRLALPAARVMLLTASRDPGRDALLKTMGVARILYKPVTMDEVVASVKEVLRLG